MANKRTRPYKDVLGFENGFVTIFKGDTYQHLDWFRLSVARYNKLWGWYITSADDVPEDVPADLTPIRLQWDDITDEQGVLKTEKEILKPIEDVALQCIKK